MKYLSKKIEIWIALLMAIYLGVLPMAGTIALRNVSLFLLLLCLVVARLEILQRMQLGTCVTLWAVFLLLFPLIADDHETAWISFTGQWGLGLLAMVAGAGAALVFSGAGGKSIFLMGVASMLPLLVHLGLTLGKIWAEGVIPWGYWGREAHHADLGYAAAQASILLTVAAFNGNQRQRAWSIGLVVAALLSVMLANSRAGLVFALLACLGVAMLAYLFRQRVAALGLRGVIYVLLFGVVLMCLAAQNDQRWSRMSNDLAVGWVGDPIQIECEGTSAVAASIAARFGSGPESERLIESVRSGDGARIVVARAGFALAMQTPFGSDGSRQAFQKLLRKECPNPAITMSHSHNGWVDTMLAIGIPGAALYLAVLLDFAIRGYRLIERDGAGNGWALVLLVLAAFWIVRGVTDSVFRDHMLEMQGFILAFALVASRNYVANRRAMSQRLMLA